MKPLGGVADEKLYVVPAIVSDAGNEKLNVELGRVPVPALGPGVVNATGTLVF